MVHEMIEVKKLNLEFPHLLHNTRVTGLNTRNDCTSIFVKQAKISKLLLFQVSKFCGKSLKWKKTLESRSLTAVNIKRKSI